MAKTNITKEERTLLNVVPRLKFDIENHMTLAEAVENLQKTTLEIQNSMEHLSACVDKVQEIDSALKNISEEVNVSIEQINQQIDQFNV